MCVGHSQLAKSFKTALKTFLFRSHVPPCYGALKFVRVIIIIINKYENRWMKCALLWSNQAFE